MHHDHMPPRVRGGVRGCPHAPESNIVCFRYAPPGVADLDALQAAIRKRLLADGSFYIVQTQLAAGLHLRTTIINPLTAERHLGALIDAVRRAGDELCV